jgi:exodeoxyribonuclease V beta subunit
MGIEFTTPQELNALTFPLYGSSLIEASAGTGKTYTIAALYVRLILGHGEPFAFRQPLAPAQILVMTFTKAATQELIDRIQRRLTDIAQALRQNINEDADPFVQGLLQSYSTQEEKNIAAWRLFEASNQMDEACVLTIDAWCQRVLKEYAILTGQPFEDELSVQEQEIQTHATEDFWRKHVYALSQDDAKALKSTWTKGFESLVLLMQKHFKAYALEVNVRQDGERDETPTTAQLGDLIAPWRLKAEALHRDLSQELLTDVHEMQTWLNHEITHFASDWDGRRFKIDKLNETLKDLGNWCESKDSIGTGALDKDQCFKLTKSGLIKMLKKGVLKDTPACFERFEDAYDTLFSLEPLAEILEPFVVEQIQAQVDLIKRQRKVFGFPDLLSRLFKGLKNEHAQELKEKIKQQFPVILIDEFQDTSPIQYAIFNEIYSIQSNIDATCVCLIGDPKQSIYAFRGADVNIYIKAKEATRGRHFVLSKNYRSTQSVVEVVNGLFEKAEASAEGAFLYGSKEVSPLPYVSVVAHGVEQEFVSKGEPFAVLKWACDLTPKAGSQLQEEFSHHCAQQVLDWLQSDGVGFLTTQKDLTQGQDLKALKPSDIAILVRTGSEARSVRRALSQRGIASVFMSDRDSVFKSQQAKDLLFWLKAVHRCTDARLLRAALASPMFGLSQVELKTLLIEDEVFDSYAALAKKLNETWGNKGVFAMLRETLFALSLPQKWILNGQGGERCLTNVLHLAEILQSWSLSMKTPQALINALMQTIVSDFNDLDEHTLRLESESDVVRVITIHKSKGLEFPIVMMPFLGIYKKAQTKDKSKVLGDEPAPDPEIERLREDLRLLYVGLTRAVYSLWLGLGRLKGTQTQECTTHLSAVGYLLSVDHSALNTNTLKATLSGHFASDPRVDMVFVNGEEVRQGRYEMLEPTQSKPARTYIKRVEDVYKISSFSSLLRWQEAHSSQTHSWISLGGAEDEPPLEVSSSLDQFNVAGKLKDPRDEESVTPVWRSMPGGVEFGNWVHELLQCLVNESVTLEQIRNRDARYVSLIEPRLQWLLALASVSAILKKNPHLSLVLDRLPTDGLTDIDETLVLRSWIEEWLRSIYSSHFLGHCTLDQLESKLTEMEFWLAIDSFDASVFTQACSKHALPNLKRERFSVMDWHGMLMGFMDLVCQIDGRYWVIDYKSNQLGAHDDAYSQSNLELDVVKNHYDIQAGIYLLALHRHLKTRLKDAYDPSQHLGGAIVWYLRGVDAHNNGMLILPATAKWMDDLEVSLSSKARVGNAQELGNF